MARRLFVEIGYDMTPMSRIASEAGVAANTIYWYFADKDALLIAVLDQLMTDGAREYRTRKAQSPEAQMIWLLGTLENVRGLIATLHARVALSPALNTWHENFHRMAEAALQMYLSSRGMPRDEVAPAARAAMFVFEGLLAHEAPRSEQQKVVQWLVTALSPATKVQPRRG